jgi:DNA-binding NarL/FixJ family response regulator
VDGHVLFAEALAWVLRRHGFDVVDVVGNALDARRSVWRSQPDLVLVDPRLPDQSGIELGRSILQESPGTKVIALSDVTEATSAREAIRSGFQGYLTKDIPVTDLASSIEDAMEGATVYRVPRTRSGNGVGGGSPQSLVLHLTPREREVLGMLAQAMGTSEIARRLTISRNTVRTHIQQLLTKLQVHNRLEAVTFAVRQGILPGPGVGPVMSGHSGGAVHEVPAAALARTTSDS